MFRRSFMEAFKVRKNANPTGYLGSASSSFAYVSRPDRITTRVIIYVATALFTINATNGFEVFYETFYHLPAPVHKTYYQNSVPKEIREPNDEIIENWKKVHEAKRLLSSFEVA